MESEQRMSERTWAMDPSASVMADEESISVQELIQTNVICLERTASVYEAAQLMNQYHIGDVVVVDEIKGRRRPIGMLTDRDITLKVVAEQKPLESTRLEDVMSTDVACAQQSDSVHDYVQAMKQAGVIRLPVVDRDGGLVGIISSKRLFKFFVQELQDLTMINRRQKSKENAH